MAELHPGVGVEKIYTRLRATEGIPFGLGSNGRIYEPLEVPLGKACGCICPACLEPIVAKHCRTSSRMAHFAHTARSECSSGFETAVHLAAKQLIAERGQLHFPNLVVTVQRVDAIGVEHRASAEIAAAGVRLLNAVVLEQWLGTIRPDVIVGANELGDVLVEIAVTHFVDEEKRNKIDRLGLAAIEIDLSGLREATFDAIAVLLFDTPSNSQWINHPEMAAVRRRLHDGLADQLAHAARLAAENHELWEGQRAQAQRDLDERIKQHALRLQEQKLLAEQESLARRQIHHAAMRRAAVFKGKTERDKLAAMTAWMGSDRLPAVLAMKVRGAGSFGVMNPLIWQTALYFNYVHKRLPAQKIVRKDDAVAWLLTRFEATPQFKDSCEIAVWDYLIGLSKRGALFSQPRGLFRIGLVDLWAFETISALTTGRVTDPNLLEWASDDSWPSTTSNQVVAQAMLGRDDLTFLWGRMVDVAPWVRRMSPSEACADAAQYDIASDIALAFFVRAGLLRLKHA